ncbi:MAG: zinc-ribbon domain-containing protein [Candidatus Poribacteria bacterium]
MKCQKCGFENPKEMKFCGKCGAKISESPTEKADIYIPKLESMQDKLYIPEP